ncbi:MULTISPECIES: Eco57I restriction-modification methylase domain-containing protein [unclassified Haloferax]|uniref:Eco57I restriction-modification methylase domain-containing protein n=1 Tax=unclassified Haloferax TaxID=2625095 RepID=UPI001EF9EEC5|nr:MULTISPECIES: DNA methyltransferase [unclassified Haloferax]
MSESGMVSAIRSTIEDFLSILHDRLDARQLERVLSGDETITSSKVRQRPEAFVEDELLWDLLADLGLERDIRPYGEGGGRGEWPDFEITNLSEPVLGEAKSLNGIDEGVRDAREYLDRKSLGPDFALATDGFEWSLLKIEQSGDSTNFPELNRINLRPVFQQIARDRGFIGQSAVDPPDIDEELAEFAATFARNAFDTRLTEAPRELRDRRQRDVEEFYELYIELLFGESNDYADDYDTCLLDDIKPPRDADVDEDEKRLFAVTLMNRLLFIKFLEQREVLERDDEDVPFLLQRLQEYESMQDELAANFYESQLKPLFYELLNTEKDDRDPKFTRGWFSEVEYLNGGLFRPNVDREKEYRVLDRTLPNIIRDLIEGSRLELSSGQAFDPALIGSVFEMTINHLNEDSDQSDTGAYYTPNDVTNLITEQSVDPKLREEIIEGYVETMGGDDDDASIIRGQLESKSLEEILQRVEEGEGWYADPDAIDAALDRIGSLTVVDPACGSGHFLTTAMDEIHRAQVSLLRGKLGDEPPADDRYEAKKTLALNSIYGVDIEPVGVEIAKLRVWLKMVEGNGWSPSFGRLPNIDVNIEAGNSLVGFPVRGPVESIDIWDERIDALDELRQNYKFEEDADEHDRREIRRLLSEEIRPEKDREFIQHLNFAVDTRIETVEAFDRVVESIDENTLFPTVESVKLQRADGDNIEAEDDLEELGYTVYSKSARLDVQSRESELKKGGNGSAREDLESELRGLLEGDYVFDEFVRKPLSCDLDDILGRPFHWTVEFPELVRDDIGRRTIDFDILLGNPPYGDLLSDTEKSLVDGYDTGSINDISANFVERQLQLLAEDGYFGNITTLRLVYQGSLEPLHDLMGKKLSGTRIACFGTRPSRVFENADIKVAIITGKRTESDDPIYTSDGIIFTDENREEKFRGIEYGSTENLVLRDEIGGDEGNRAILPKVGPDIKRGILEKLRDYDGDVFSEVYERDEVSDGFPVWRREGLRYWTNVMREELYEAREVKPMFYETELERDAAFIVLNSSLFYTYWLTYGNFHHLNWTQIKAFPFPEQESLNEHEEEITELADELWEEMEDHFYPERGRTGEFEMSPVKPVVDRVDDLLQDVYDLSDEEVEFVQNYLTDCGPGMGRVGPQNEDVRGYGESEAEVEAED